MYRSEGSLRLENFAIFVTVSKLYLHNVVHLIFNHCFNGFFLIIIISIFIVFDAHDTDDCPVQSSESSPMHTAAPITNNGNLDGTKMRVIPPPRKYCNACESMYIDRFLSKITNLLPHIHWFVLFLFCSV